MTPPSQFMPAIAHQVLVLSAVAVSGCCGADSLPGSAQDAPVSWTPKVEGKLEVCEKQDWQAVRVLKRFFQENDPNETLVHMTRRYGQPAWAHCRFDDQVRIVKAIVNDCGAPDAEIDTMGGMAVQPIAIGIILEGPTYAIFFGLDTSGGCRMGDWQYRWKGPGLAKVLGDIFRREGMLKGRYGKLYSEVLRAVGSGRPYTGPVADLFPSDEPSSADPRRVLCPSSDQ